MMDSEIKGRIGDLKSRVTSFAEKFPMPGYDGH